MNFDKDKLHITLTKSAISQIKLIKENDYTLDPKSLFRLKIGGKGCDGFTYETGFSLQDSEDIIYNFEDIEILIDPFTAFYFQEGGSIDFVNDIENNTDGFVIENNNEGEYKGKFFKDESKVPQK